MALFESANQVIEDNQVRASLSFSDLAMPEADSAVLGISENSHSTSKQAYIQASAVPCGLQGVATAGHRLDCGQVPLHGDTARWGGYICIIRLVSGGLSV